MMRRITIEIDYATRWGQNLYIMGSIPALGGWNGEKRAKLECRNFSTWQIEFDASDDVMQIEFKFLVVENDEVIREEAGIPHSIMLSDRETQIKCLWQDKTMQAYFETSVFTNSIFKQKMVKKIDAKGCANGIEIVVRCLHVEDSQELVVAGGSVALGAWIEQDALPLQSLSYGKWHGALDRNMLPYGDTYKFAIRDRVTKKIVEWEDGANRVFDWKPNACSVIEELQYRKERVNWKAAGVAIPVFSLRSEKSFGIGEFVDLKLLVDWAADAKLRVIQVLPINDTTATYAWADSYPYNAVSVYALHPIYLALHTMPLKNKAENEKYDALAKKLNLQPEVDYPKVMELKRAYIKALYDEMGESMLKTKAYKEFYKRNENWLFAYACFSYLRDKYKTAHIAHWEEYRIYDEKKLETLAQKNKAVGDAISCTYFTQYLLHKQLTDAKEYAYTKGIVLKGDIPIGVSPNSVETWTEPHLFNIDSQTGAPPDDFSVNGQNWGFPTYNWKEMEKDGYGWWIKRFAKMADYFDAYRIDHILGFFRIWEIPNTSVHGLLGHFSPALPLLRDEIEWWGFAFDEQMTLATIHQDDLPSLFGKDWLEVQETYLECASEEWYCLKKEYDNQKKIENVFHKKVSPKDLTIRDGLYTICNEVLFVHDKCDAKKFHPRISIQHTLRYKRLDVWLQHTLYRLYEDFFYHRHTQFWKEEAMSKLPTLIDATNMLVCGEDLGMVPKSVAAVMNDLQILSLEIQRMPKQLGARFEHLQHLPYLSVTTTSTHDMSPIRLWWQEDTEKTQDYFENILSLHGQAAKDCNTAISIQIVREHLKSPAMLAILPLQDWLATSDKLKRKNAEEEKINEPSDPHHNWNYRMHLTLEKLIEEKEFSELICFLNEESGR